VHRLLHRVLRQGAIGEETASAPAQGTGEPSVANPESSWVQAYMGYAEGEGQRVHSDNAPADGGEAAEGKRPDLFEGLRGEIEAVLLVAHEAAEKIKATAQAEVEATLRTKTRQAAEKLEEAERDAAELRGRAERALEEAEGAATKLREAAEADAASSRREAEAEASRVLADASAAAEQSVEASERQRKALDERLELTQERLRELVSGLRQIAAHLEELVAGAAGEANEEHELDESLREVAEASAHTGGQTGNPEPPGWRQ
jgi:uncharacterized membrane protein YqiK